MFLVREDNVDMYDDTAEVAARQEERTEVALQAAYSARDLAIFETKRWIDEKKKERRKKEKMDWLMMVESG